MINENVFPELNSGSNSFINLIEQNNFNLQPELSLVSGIEVNNFYSDYLELTALADVELDNSKNDQLNLNNQDFLIGLEEIEPVVVGTSDLLINSLTLNSSAAAGSVVNFSYSVSNIGNASVNSNKTKYYLSNNTTFENNDWYLGDDSAISVASGATITRNDSAFLSSSINSGSYYFLVVADGYNIYPESNETNNVFAQAIQITKPDLVSESSSITIPNSLVAGKSYKFNYTLSNQGNAAASSSKTKYFLSSDATLDTADTYLGIDSVASIAAGTSITRTPTVTLSSTLSAGTYYFLTQVDTHNSVAETNEANNITAKIVDTQAAPDLVLKSLNIPNSIYAAGSSLELSYTVENKGGSTAGLHSTRFYLSTNPTFESTDISIGIDAVASVAVGATNLETAKFTISSNVKDGNYYILALADSANSIKESIETNNWLISLSTIEITKPDLEITQFTLDLPKAAQVGSTVSVNYTIANNGKALAKANTIKYYLSTDSTFDSSDIYLGDDAVISLAAGATVTKTDSFLLNTSLGNGVYYFLAVADANKNVAESNEDNNIASQIENSDLEQPDLILDPLAGSLVVSKGSDFNLSYTIKNQGSIDAGASTTQFYLSADAILSSNDIALGSDPVATLNSSANSSEGITLSIANSLNTGTYYLLAQADGKAVVTESDETNNIVYQTVQIVEAPKPDLVIDNLTVANTVIQGSSLSLAYNIRNKGNAIAGGSTTQFYLSTNATLDELDILLGSDVVQEVASNIVSPEEITLNLNSSINPGTYYLLAQADGSNIVIESNENNNLIAQTLQIIEPNKPDLLIDTLATPPQIAKGSSLLVPYNIQNQGSADAGASTTKFYLSTDATLDSNDSYLGSDLVAGLSSNAASPEDVTLTIPNNLSVGTYYLFAFADSGNLIIESNENNNSSYQAISVTEQSQPDLLINPMTINANGINLSISYTLKNQGSKDAVASTTKFYVSTDKTLDTADTLLGSDAVTALLKQSQSIESVALKLPATLTSGTYYILGYADSDNLIAESNETNNTVSSALSVKPDLTLSNFSVGNGTNKVTQGYGFTPTYTLKNQGNATAPASARKITLSKDDILGNADDINVKILSDGGLDAGLSAGQERVEKNDWLVIYDNLVPGLYNLFLQTDPSGAIAESNETNNILSTKIDFSYPPQPDLLIEQFELHTTANVGAYVNIDYTLANRGQGNSSYSQIGFYLSQDTVVDALDIDLGYMTVASEIPNNMPISRGMSLLLDPGKVQAGSYYLIAMADPNKALVESDEINNTSVKMLTVNPEMRPELSTSNLLFSNTTVNGTPYLETGYLFSLPYTLSNAGGAAKNTQTDFYLSTDNAFDSTDKIIGSHQTLALSAGASRSEYASIYISPDFALSGTQTYYFIARADSGPPSYQIAESNETNNFTIIPITLTNSGTAIFTHDKGYGFVNAAAAVASAVGLNSFADVTNKDKNWGVDWVKAPEVWAQGITGQGIIVAVIDTGVDYNHPDLKDNIWVNVDEIDGNGIDDDGNGFVDDVKGWNFIANNNTPLDTVGHGTHVAGIIAAERNSIGYNGVAPDALIMPLKVLGGGDEWAAVKNAIRYAVDNGARVINMSMGGITSDQDGRLKDVLKYASEKGVIVVSAAGNDNEYEPKQPGSYADKWGLVVGAADPTGKTTSYSNKAGDRGILAYVTAPGISTATLPNNKYGGMQGTSMASPHIAGVVALMLQANPNLTDAQVRAIITQTATTGTLNTAALPNSVSSPTPPLEGSEFFNLHDLVQG